MRTELEARAAVIAEAREWIGTPYIPSGRVKGKNGGCDCLTFVAGVYENAGVIDRLPIPHYPPDWHMHNEAELYLVGKDDCPGMLNFCNEIEGPPQPADIMLLQFGMCYSHAAIVVEWPTVIHAWAKQPVNTDDALANYTLLKVFEVSEIRGQLRKRRFFSVKEWR